MGNELPNYSNPELDNAQWAYADKKNSFEEKKYQDQLVQGRSAEVGFPDGHSTYLQGPASHDAQGEPAKTPYMNPGTGFQSYFLTNQADAKASTQATLAVRGSDTDFGGDGNAPSDWIANDVMFALADAKIPQADQARQRRKSYGGRIT